MESRSFIAPPDLASRLRQRADRRGIIGLRGFGTLFRQEEENGDQTFSVSRDLPKILSDFGVFLNKTEIAELVRHLDTDATGEVSLIDFLAFVAPPLSPDRAAWVSKAFDRHDPGGSGSLELSKIRRLNSIHGSVVTRLAATQSSPEMLLYNLIRYYDQDGANSIPREEFVDFYRLVSARFEANREFIAAIRIIWAV
jgi:Ca2+-binding EF-hand superfamily protein